MKRTLTAQDKERRVLGMSRRLVQLVAANTDQSGNVLLSRSEHKSLLHRARTIASLTRSTEQEVLDSIFNEAQLQAAARFCQTNDNKGAQQ